MKFTDIYIQRPVLASVVSLLILVVVCGRSRAHWTSASTRDQRPVITVTTSYPGASSELVRVSSPHHCSRRSPRRGASTTCRRPAVRAVGDRGAHAPELSAQRCRRRDPGQGREPTQRTAEDAQDPVITSQTGDRTALMYMAFTARR